jgi:hypothetical protein
VNVRVPVIKRHILTADDEKLFALLAGSRSLP